VLAPLAAAMLVLLLHAAVGRRLGAGAAPIALWRRLGLAVSTLQLVAGGGLLWLGFDPEALGPQHAERYEWLPQYGFDFHLALDGLSLFPVLLVLFMVPVACWSTPANAGRFTAGAVARVFAIQSALLGVLLSVNVMQLFFCWTLLLLPTFFVIVSWGGDRALRAAYSWLVPAALGNALLLFALIVVHRLGYEQLHVWVFDLVSGREGGASGLLDVTVPVVGPVWAIQSVLFVAVLASVAMRVRAFPFHVWSASASEHAPPDGIVLLDVLPSLVGVYIVVRVGLPLFPEGAAAVAPWASTVAVVGLAYGAFIAGAQHDLRRLQAYAHTAAIGLVALGVFTLGEHGLVGALMYGWSIGLASSAVLVLVGLLADRRQSMSLDDFGGLTKPMPVFSLLFAVSLFAFSGIPGTLGFVGELLVLAGGFARSPALALAALLGVLLSGACLLRAYRAVALGPVLNPENRGLIDLDWSERVCVLALLLPVVVVGVHPNPMLRRVEPAVLEILHAMELRQADAVASGTEAEPVGGRSPQPGTEPGTEPEAEREAEQTAGRAPLRGAPHVAHASAARSLRPDASETGGEGS
jgi:NADH-quinone oxidoreductase subunit M